MKKYKDGGIYTAPMGQPPKDIDGGSAPSPKKPRPKTPSKAPAKKMAMGGVMKYAKGGGCEIKGKTKGTMVKMAKGGSSC
jgi:hypothetical protein